MLLSSVNASAEPAADSSPKQTVCVTGVSGYLGSVLASRLLERGYDVIGTVRSIPKWERSLRERLGAHKGSLKVVEADILDSEALVRAFRGCKALMHTASPFWFNPPGGDPMNFVTPAVEGTKVALRAAHQNEIRRVVVTSSTAAITPQTPGQREKAYTEEDWNRDSTLTAGPYRYSKRLAEEAAWELAKELDIELSVMNPSFILGPPVLKRIEGESLSLMARLLEGGGNLAAGVPAACFGICDVRDVADAHIAAIERSEAVGKRFLISSARGYSNLEIANMLRASGKFDDMHFPTSELGEPAPCVQYDASRFTRVLKVAPHEVSSTVVDMAGIMSDMHQYHLMAQMVKRTKEL